MEKTPFSTVQLPTVLAGKTRFLSIAEETQLCQAVGHPCCQLDRAGDLTGMRTAEQFSLRRGPTLTWIRAWCPPLHQERLCAVYPLDGGSQGDPAQSDCRQYPCVGVPLAEPRHAPGPPQLLGRGLSALTRNGETWGRHLAHPASDVRLTAGDERPGTEHHRSLLAAQWDGSGEPVCPPLPYPSARSPWGRLRVRESEERERGDGDGIETERGKFNPNRVSNRK